MIDTVSWQAMQFVYGQLRVVSCGAARWSPAYETLRRWWGVGLVIS